MFLAFFAQVVMLERNKEGGETVGQRRRELAESCWKFYAISICFYFKLFTV